MTLKIYQEEDEGARVGVMRWVKQRVAMRVDVFFVHNAYACDCALSIY